MAMHTKHHVPCIFHLSIKYDNNTSCHKKGCSTLHPLYLDQNRTTIQDTLVAVIALRGIFLHKNTSRNSFQHTYEVTEFGFTAGELLQTNSYMN